MAWQQAGLEPPDAVAGAIRTEHDQALATAARCAAAEAPGLAVDTARLAGPPALALTEAASDASMLVVGSRGAGGFTAMLLGSVSRYVASHAPSPVVVVREESAAMPAQIVVGVRDLDQPAALGFAFTEARLRKARLHAIHAWDWFMPAMRLTGTERPGAAASAIGAEAAGWLASLIAPWRQMYPDVEVIEDVVHAHPGRVLAGASARADLLVIGRDGAGDPDDHGTGAVTHSVLHHAHCPVAIIGE
jgi:nucleotide-binding universal stress UspA family protein